MAPLAGLALLGHGGLGGAIVEVVLVVGLLAVFLAVYLRERGSSRDEDAS
ncbi:MAG: hypothetical protein H0V94_06000 [Actinobacteria bacterium]|nr:hypothetical protein [Actinomycetota bacterium]